MRFAKRSDDTLIAHLRIVVLVQERTHHVVDQLVLQVEEVDREGRGEADKADQADLAEDFCSQFHIHSRYLPFLVRRGVVELNDRRVERLLVHDDGHILVDAVTHILTGNGAAVLQVMLDEDEVEAEVACLLLHHGMHAEHALAGDVVVHEHHVAVEVRGPLPDGVDVVPAADGHVTHAGLLGQAGQVVHGDVRILGVDHVVAHRGVHVQDDVDAPAVLRPGREVGVIHGGGAPQERAVAGLAAERLVLILVSLAHDLDDLAVDLVVVRVGAVDGLPLIELVERLGDADERGVRRLEVVPLLELDLVLLVHALGALEERLPVELRVVVLFDEGDGLFHDLAGERQRRGLVVDHGEGCLIVGQADAAALEHGRRLGGVAGHVRGDDRPADDRERVIEGDAGLRRAAGAHVGRQAEGLGHVDVVRLDVLVDVADDELRQRLQRHRVQIREAGHEQLGPTFLIFSP